MLVVHRSTGLAAALLVLALAPARADDEKKPADDKRKPDAEREANEATYAREAEALKKKHAGKWVAISGGNLQGPFDSFDKADKASDKATPGARHRFIYQPRERSSSR